MICVHDKWRFGRHLLYPAFCLLWHHADTKDTARICLDITEQRVGGRREGEIALKYCHFHCNPGAILLNCEMLAAARGEQEEPLLIQRHGQEASFVREEKCIIQNKSHLVLITRTNEAKLDSLVQHQGTTPVPADEEGGYPHFSLPVRGSKPLMKEKSSG